MWQCVCVCIYITLLVYTLKEICPPYWTYMSHCTTTVLYTENVHYVLKKKLQLLFTMLLPYMCQQKIHPSNATYMQHMKISPCEDMRQQCKYMYIIWVHCNQQCDQIHYYTYISHYWHMPLITKMPATACLLYSMYWCDTTAYNSNISNKMQF